MDDRRRDDTLAQGLEPPPNALPFGGGAEVAVMALDLHRASRWTGTVLGAMLTPTVVFAHVAHAGV